MNFTGERFVPIGSLLQDEMAFEHFHRYYSVKGVVAGKRVLDIACGEGYGSAILAATAKKVYGVDIDTASIAHATQLYGSHYANTEFIKGNVTAIPMPDKSVDVVVSFETLEHIDELSQQRFVDEVKRVLAPGGLLVLSTPNIENYSERYHQTNEFHVKELNRSEFSALLQKSFANVSLFTQGYEIVSAITPEHLEAVTETKVLDWKRDYSKPFSRKYLLAACTDVGTPADLSSIVFQVSTDYLELTDRLVEKENRIVELGNWGQTLDAELNEKNTYIRKLQDEAHELQAGAQLLSDKVAHYEQQEDIREKLSQMQSGLEAQIKLINERLAREFERNAELDQVKLDFETARQENLELTEALKQQLEANEFLEDDLKKREDEFIELQSILLLADSGNELVNAELSSAPSLSVRELVELHIDSGRNKEARLVELAAQVSDLTKQLEQFEDYKHLHRQQEEKIGDLTRRLATAENRLAEIYSSGGWSMLKKYYNLKGKLLPEDSQRYLFLRNTINKIRGKKLALEAPQITQVTGDTPFITEAESLPESYEPIEFIAYNSPVISIIIPIYNAWSMTYRCLQSIRETVIGEAYEVIIADDASTDEHIKDITSYVRNIKVSRNESNRGFLLNCNKAAGQAEGRYIVFLNNDTTVRPGWLKTLRQLIESDDTIGMTGSKLIYPDGRMQEAGGIIWNDASGWNFGHLQDPDAAQFNYVKEVDYISGASIMIRTSLWQQLGGFDKQYTPAYCEDSDLAFAVREAGYKVVYQPLSEVIHHEGYSHGEQSKEYQVANNRKFFEKWKTVLHAEQFNNGEQVFWARDRSRNKKTILVIDHYVPHYDKDAGSKTVFQYLKLFVSLGLNVKFIGDNFYRHEPYTTTIQQMGIEVLYGHWYSEHWKEWISDNGDKLDYVLLNRPHISIKYMDFIRKHTSAVRLYYGHDLHFVRDLKQYELEKDPALLQSSEEWKKKEISLFNQADIVLTPGDEERKIVAGLGIQATVISISPYIYYDKANPVTSFEHRRAILFVGGFNHKPNVDGILWFINSIWPSIASQLAGATLHIVGSNAPAEVLAINRDDVKVHGFVTDSELNDLYATTRVTIIPLRYGAGVKGKTVEALYHGLPVVSTSFGIEGLPPASFLRAYDDEKAFGDSLVTTYNSDDRRLLKVSDQSTEYINRYFYVDAIRDHMAAILEASGKKINIPVEQ